MANFFDQFDSPKDQPKNFFDQFDPVAAPEKEPESGFLRQVADVPLGIAKGAASGVRMIADIFGAGSAASEAIKGAENYLTSLMSAQSRNDSREIARIMKDAEDKGVLDQVKAGLQAFMVAPVDMLSQALGTAAPAIVGGLGSKVLGAGALAVRGTQAAIGAGMGAGVTKGSIYESVKEELSKTDMPPDQIEARAQLAQSYGGQNLDQILLGTALGGLAATTGIEPAIAGIAARNVLSRAAAKSATGRVATGAVAEAAPEFAQGLQEQVAQNIALQREGYDVPTFRGAVGAGTLEGIAGAGLGAGVSALTGRGVAAPTREEPPQEPPKLIGYDPSSGEPMFAFPDGSVAVGEEAAFARRYQPQPVEPTVEPPKLLGYTPGAGRDRMYVFSDGSVAIGDDAAFARRYAPQKLSPEELAQVTPTLEEAPDFEGVTFRPIDQPPLPVTPEEEAELAATKERRKTDQQRIAELEKRYSALTTRAGKGESLRDALAGILSSSEVIDIGSEPYYRRTFAAKKNQNGRSIADLVANKQLDDWLPEDYRINDEIDSPETISEKESAATEYIKEKLRNRDFRTFAAEMEARDIDNELRGIREEIEREAGFENLRDILADIYEEEIARGFEPGEPEYAPSDIGQPPSPAREAEPFALAQETEQERLARETEEARAREEREAKAIADRERGVFTLTPPAAEAVSPPTGDLFGARGLAEQPAKRTMAAPPAETGLFAPTAEAPKVEAPKADPATQKKKALQSFALNLGNVVPRFRAQRANGRVSVTNPKPLSMRQTELLINLARDAIDLGLPPSLLNKITAAGSTGQSSAASIAAARGWLMLGNQWGGLTKAERIHTLVHEIGHTVDFKSESNRYSISKSAEWTKAHEELQAWYDRDPSLENPLKYPFAPSFRKQLPDLRIESFPQAFALYFVDPVGLQNNAPSAYASIQSIVERINNEPATAGAAGPAETGPIRTEVRKARADQGPEVQPRSGEVGVGVGRAERVQDRRPEVRLKKDNPGGDWLKNKREQSVESGLNEFGVPNRFGSVTGSLTRTILVPVEKLSRVKGMRGEQRAENIRPKSLESLTQVMSNTGRLPQSGSRGGDYAPFLNIYQNGTPYVNEGNHRIMVAKKLGWKYLPVEVSWFNGAEQVGGDFSPEALFADEARAYEEGFSLDNYGTSGREAEPTVLIDDLIKLKPSQALEALKKLTQGKQPPKETLTPEGEVAKKILDTLGTISNPKPKAADETLLKRLQGKFNLTDNISLETRFRRAVVDKDAPVIEQLKTQFNNAVKDELGEIRPDLALMQGQDVSNFSDLMTQKGGIRIGSDGLINTFEAKDANGKPINMDRVLELIAVDLGKKLGSADLAMQLAHNALIAFRSSEIIKNNQQIRVRADNMRLAAARLMKSAKAEDKKLAKQMKSDADSMLNNLIEVRASQEEIDAGLEAMRMYPEIQEAYDVFTAYKNNLVDFLLETGRINELTAKNWKENVGYVPWTRVEEETNKFELDPRSFKNGVVNLSALPKLDKEGSSKEINNIFDNMVGLTYWAVRSGVNNYAAQKTLNALPDVEVIPEDRVSDMRQKHPDRVVFSYTNGERQAYLLSSPFQLATFSTIAPIKGGMFSAVFAPAARFLRATITHMPAFAVSQLIQDGTYRAALLSGVKNPWKLPPKVFKNFYKALRKQKTGALGELERIGVSGIYDGMPEASARKLRQRLNLEHRNAFKRAWDALEEFSLAADLAVRSAIYEQTMAETGDRALAYYRAKEYINFKRQGTDPIIYELRQSIPFFNAYLQGMDVLYRTMTGKGVATGERRAAMKLFYMTGMQIAALNLIYAMMMSGDDDYEGLDDYVRNRNYILPGGFKLPVAPEVGFLFKVIPEQLYRAVMSEGVETPQDATAVAKRLTGAFADSFGGVEYLPQLIKPIVELSTNYSFFLESPIVGAGLKNVDPALQFTESTSELAKTIGGMANISPVKLDYFIRAYTGMAGALGLELTDSLMNPDRMGKPIYKTPQISTFMYDPTGRGFKSDFYKFREEIDKVSDTVNMMKREGKAEELAEYLTEEKATRFALRGMINKVEAQLSKLRNYRKIIAADTTLTPAERREMVRDILDQERELIKAYDVKELRKIAGF